MPTNVAALPVGRISLALEPPEVAEGNDGVLGLLTSQSTACTAGVTHGRYLSVDREAGVGSHFVLKMGDHWFRKVDLAQAKNLILNFNVVIQGAPRSSQPQRLEWPLKHALLDLTDFDLAPVLNRLDEETAQFIVDHDLAGGAAWLQSAAPCFFEGADFEVCLLPAEDGETGLLALKVHGAFTSSEFRKRRQRLCRAMLAADHRKLYEAISVFQRRVIGDGWQAFSWYSSLSAE